MQCSNWSWTQLKYGLASRKVSHEFMTYLCQIFCKLYFLQLFILKLSFQHKCQIIINYFNSQQFYIFIFIKYFIIFIQKIKEIQSSFQFIQKIIQKYTQIIHSNQFSSNNIMQQQPNENPNYTKTKQEREKQKANTDAWYKKQQQKKKKKIEEQEKKQQLKPAQMDQKALEKARLKQQRRLQRQEMLKEQGLLKPEIKGQSKQQIKNQTKTQCKQKIQKKEHLKQQNKQDAKIENNKKQQKQGQKIQSTEKQSKKNSKKANQHALKTVQNQPKPQRKLSKQQVKQKQLPKIVYAQLLTLEHHLNKSTPRFNLWNKSTQQKLVFKYLDQYITPADTVLILAREDKWHPSQSNRVFLYPIHEQFEKCQQNQNIVCTYQDVVYLMQGTLTKIFVQLDLVFGNGSSLTEKGNQNIITLANEFKIPVIGFTGSWNFNAWNFLSLDIFMNKYGESHLQKYDVLEAESFQIIVLQIGSIIPKQISGHLQSLSKIYRGYDLTALKW